MQELFLKFHEFGKHCETRLQITYSRIPFRLELLNGLVKVSNGSSDLLINENCTLLQITPDVAHRALSRVCPNLSRQKCEFTKER